MNLRLVSRFLGVISLLIGATMIASLPWAHPSLGWRHDVETLGHIEWNGLVALTGSIVVCFAVGGLFHWLSRGEAGKLFRKEAMAVVGLSWILATVLGALPFIFSGTYRSASVRLTGPDEAVHVHRFRLGIRTTWIVKPVLTSRQYAALQVLLKAGGRGLGRDSFNKSLNRRRLLGVAERTYQDAILADVEWEEKREKIKKLYAEQIGISNFDESTAERKGEEVLSRARELSSADFKQWLVDDLVESGARVLKPDEFEKHITRLQELRAADEHWSRVIIFPGEVEAPDERENYYRIRWVKMGITDALFESQSGFSTTGATVISDLEDPVLVTHCILFWRSSMHFLGGLGIIVLFVVILGQGSAGKALMRAEMPGPTKEGATARMQHTAWLTAAAYGGLNLILAVLLYMEGMSLFDALCHAFGTMATGGFSTYNASVGHFDSSYVDYTITLFMILAGTNFTLLYFLILRQPDKLFSDIEWRTYLAIIFGVTLLVVILGFNHGDFSSVSGALRYGLFQVVSIMTTTGYGTHDFDRWNTFGRGVLFLLMFVGGCAGSTGGGLKVIRHILFVKILRLEIEYAFHPTVVRPLRLGGRPVDDPNLRRNILVYFGLILIIFVFSWLFVITLEPDATWGPTIEHKLIDSASAVAANLNNIGPGLGTVGATQNYSHFSPINKVLFVWLMMIGRLEIFAILVLFVPAFWRDR